MMRSLYAGVSGLKTHQTKMDVIGNNIANVNTLAYKSSSITFSELMYQTTQNASGPNATTGRGGINARQIGLGTQTGAIDTNITTEGSPQTTGYGMHLKISGESFFVVSDGKSNYFTRAGAFYQDASGNLAMTSNGYNVMGWGVDDTGTSIKKGTVQSIRLKGPGLETYEAEATTKAYISGIVDNLDTDLGSSSGRSMNLQFYDSKGYSYTAKMAMKQSGTDGKYSVQLVDVLDDNGNSVMSKYPNLSMGTMQKFMDGNPPVATPKKVKPDSIVYDTTVAPPTYQIGTGTAKPISTLYDPATGATSEDMKIIAERYGYDTVKEFMDSEVDTDGAATGTGANVAKMSTLFAGGGAGFAALVTAAKSPAGELSFTGYTGATVEYDIGKGKFESINGNTATKALTLNFGSYQEFVDISVDFSKSSNEANGGKSTIAAKPGDVLDQKLGTGRKIGTLVGVAINPDGTIYASYSNGQSRLLGQIAVATFSNPSGLKKEGDNLYAATLNSGDFDGVGHDISDSSGGAMTSGALEMSNVDLSGEFTEMITTQRGFQANSRIITVSDTMLEELVNLKR